MPFRTVRPARASQLVQVLRRRNGRLAYRLDGAPLHAGEMLIGRGLTPTEALGFILESARSSKSRG